MGIIELVFVMGMGVALMFGTSPADEVPVEYQLCLSDMAEQPMYDYYCGDENEND